MLLPSGPFPVLAGGPGFSKTKDAEYMGQGFLLQETGISLAEPGLAQSSLELGSKKRR